MGSPRLVLLDEPTDGLDVDAAQTVRRLVEERRGRCTFVIASHNADVLAKVCTHTVSLG
jgi:ATPase subunit of ABC transporter with duplicated ATPase domains